MRKVVPGFECPARTPAKKINLESTIQLKTILSGMYNS